MPATMTITVGKCAGCGAPMHRKVREYDELFLPVAFCPACDEADRKRRRKNAAARRRYAESKRGEA